MNFRGEGAHVCAQIHPTNAKNVPAHVHPYAGDFRNTDSQKNLDQGLLYFCRLDEGVPKGWGDDAHFLPNDRRPDADIVDEHDVDCRNLCRRLGNLSLRGDDSYRRGSWESRCVSFGWRPLINVIAAPFGGALHALLVGLKARERADHRRGPIGGAGAGASGTPA